MRFTILLIISLICSQPLVRAQTESVTKRGFTIDNIHFYKLNNGNILSTGNEKFLWSSAWTYDPNVYAWDSLGHLLDKWTIDASENGGTTVNAATQLNDSTLTFVGRDFNECMWCGTGYINFNAISGSSLNGQNTHFNKMFNRLQPGGNPVILKLLKTGDGDLMYLSVLNYTIINTNGDSIITNDNMQNYFDGFSISSTRMLFLSASGIYKSNNMGGALDSMNIPGLEQMERLNDSKVVATTFTGNTIVADTSMVIIRQNNFNFNIVDVKTKNDTIYLLGKNGNSYKLLWVDELLNRIDSVEVHSFSTIDFNEVFLYENHFILAGTETVNTMNQPVLKTFNYVSNPGYSQSLDAGVTSFHLDLYGVSNSWGSSPDAPQDDKNLTFDVYTTIENFGDVIIDTIMVLCKADKNIIFYDACYYPIVHKEFSGLNLAPGQSQELYVGRLVIIEVEQGYQFNACAWTDIPNYKIDHDAANNDVCSSFIFTSMDEPIKADEITIYPNPSPGLFNIDSKIPATYSVKNALGQLLENTMQRGKIDLRDQPPGIYFLEIKTENGLDTKKLIVQ